MPLQDEIRAVADGKMMDVFGIADITSARAAVCAQGGDEIGAFPRAVSIGKTLAHAIVDMLDDSADRKTAEVYRYYCYDLVNDLLDNTGLRIASLLQAAGYAALPVPAAPRAVDGDRLCAVFSNKLAAHMAGLGWIGKSCLLVTPEAGPRVRWAGILTDAPLSPTGKPMPQRCGDCRACVDACPARAFTGRAFHAGGERDARFGAFACNRHMRTMKEEIGRRVCGLCLKVCPYGVKGSERSRRRTEGTKQSRASRS